VSGFWAPTHKPQPPAIVWLLGSYTRKPQPPACLSPGHQRTSPQPPAIVWPLGSHTRKPQPPACLASEHQRTQARSVAILAQEARRVQPALCEPGRGHAQLLRSVPSVPQSWAACLPPSSPLVPARAAPMRDVPQRRARCCRLSSDSRRRTARGERCIRIVTTTTTRTTVGADIGATAAWAVSAVAAAVEKVSGG